MSEDSSPPGPPRPSSGGVGETILGIFAGLAISGVVVLVCGVMIAASELGGALSILSAVGLLVFQIRGWKRTTGFQRGLLLGQIFGALIAGTCFVMTLNFH